MRKNLRTLGAVVAAACVSQFAGMAQASNSDALDWCTPYPQQCFNCTTIYAKLRLENCIQRNVAAYPFKIKLNGIDVTRYAHFCGNEVTICLRRDRGLNINYKDCCDNYRYNTLYAEGFEEVTNEKFSTVVFFRVSQGRREMSTDTGVCFDKLDLSGLGHTPTPVQKAVESGFFTFMNVLEQAAELAPNAAAMVEMGPPADVIS